MDQYMQNKPRFVQGHLGVARAVVAGDALVTLDGTSSVLDLRHKGEPIQVAVSQKDATPFFTLAAGIFRKAPHPNAAKLFLTWYMQPEQQRRTGVYSSRRDVPPPDGMQPFDAYANVANSYREFVSDQVNLEALRKRFETYTGPVVNKGGVR